MNAIWGREPAMVLALVQCVIVLAVSFGLHLTPEQTGAILALTAVVLGLITRSQVTPAGAPQLPQGTSIEVTTPKGENNYTVTA